MQSPKEASLARCSVVVIVVIIIVVFPKHVGLQLRGPNREALEEAIADAAPTDTQGKAVEPPPAAVEVVLAGQLAEQQPNVSEAIRRAAELLDYTPGGPDMVASATALR